MRLCFGITALLLSFVDAAIKNEDNGDFRLVQLRTHSLQKPFLDQDYQSRWWDFGGTTVVDAANHYDRQHSTGWLWSRLPITATNYEVEFEFRINGRGTGIYGDGLAMWLTTGRTQTGPVFGNKDHFEGLGVFIDTYKNGRGGITFPLVSAMIGDGQTAYDTQNDGKGTEFASCSARGLRGSSVPTKGRLTYYKDDYLKFELQYKNVDEWTECFNVQGKTLPNVIYLGFTAITGEVSDNHDILSVSTRNIFSTGGTQSSPSGKQKYLAKEDTSSVPRKGSWFGFLLKLIIFGGVCFGVAYAYKAYKKSKKQDYMGF